MLTSGSRLFWRLYHIVIILVYSKMFYIGANMHVTHCTIQLHTYKLMLMKYVNSSDCCISLLKQWFECMLVCVSIYLFYSYHCYLCIWFSISYLYRLNITEKFQNCSWISSFRKVYIIHIYFGLHRSFPERIDVVLGIHWLLVTRYIQS